jgi:hypothetical protein
MIFSIFCLVILKGQPRLFEGERLPVSSLSTLVFLCLFLVLFPLNTLCSLASLPHMGKDRVDRACFLLPVSKELNGQMSKQTRILENVLCFYVLFYSSSAFTSEIASRIFSFVFCSLIVSIRTPECTTTDRII